MASDTQISVGRAREEFLALVGDLRPELHRYCARLTGSVIEGEDIVQETLAKAFYTLSLSPTNPPLRPWLFKIAHNTAVDFLKRNAPIRWWSGPRWPASSRFPWASAAP